MCHFGESIDNGEDGVETAGYWEIDDEVAGYRFPGSRGNRERCQFSMGSVTGRFTAGTQITG
jgi:hypothetical protein